MNRLPLFALCLAIASLFTSCLTTPVADTGGPGSTTVTNSNPSAIMTAANSVFAQSGYTPGPSNFPNSISFMKPAGMLGKMAYGSYGTTTTIQVTLNMAAIPGTNNYRLSTRVSRVSNAGEAGFEDDQKMLGFWSGQFKPLLQQIQAQASGAGAY